MKPGKKAFIFRIINFIVIVVVIIFLVFLIQNNWDVVASVKEFVEFAGKVRGIASSE